MKKFLPLLGLMLAALSAQAADRIVVTVTNDLALARPAETISVPFAEVRRLLDAAHADPRQYWNSTRNVPKVRYDNLVVKDAAGKIIPSQVTNLDTKGGRNFEYNDVLFQHDFAAGEKKATFTIEAVDTVAPPFPSKVYCRFVPDRLDDFAWENDRIAHRIYGPALEQPIAGPDLMPVGGSGIDVWVKRPAYFIIDRWYAKGHNPLHTENGEGLDMYEVGQSRGLGGTGVWDGKTMYVSRDFRTWKVMANGPIRAEFELNYDVWDAGNGAKISEVKHFIMDAGVNFTQVTSTFTITGADELTIGLGVTQHNGRQDNAKLTPKLDEQNHWEAFWEEFPRDGQLGTGIVLAPSATFAGFAHSDSNEPRGNNLRAGDGLILAKVKSGVPLSYAIGAGWDRSGQFSGNADWFGYVGAWSQRLRSPVKVALALEAAK